MLAALILPILLVPEPAARLDAFSPTPSRNLLFGHFRHPAESPDQEPPVAEPPTAVSSSCESDGSGTLSLTPPACANEGQIVLQGEVTVAKALALEGDVTVQKDIRVEGQVSMRKGLEVAGAAILHGEVSVAGMRLSPPPSAPPACTLETVGTLAFMARNGGADAVDPDSDDDAICVCMHSALLPEDEEVYNAALQEENPGAAFVKAGTMLLEYQRLRVHPERRAKYVRRTN